MLPNYVEIHITIERKAIEVNIDVIFIVHHHLI